MVVETIDGDLMKRKHNRVFLLLQMIKLSSHSGAVQRAMRGMRLTAAYLLIQQIQINIHL